MAKKLIYIGYAVVIAEFLLAFPLAAFIDANKIPGWYLIIFFVLMGGIGFLLITIGENLQKVWKLESVKEVPSNKINSRNDVPCVKCLRFFENPPDEAYGQVHLGTYLDSKSEHHGNYIQRTDRYRIDGSKRGIVCNGCVQERRQQKIIEAIKIFTVWFLSLVVSLMLKISPLVVIILFFGIGVIIIFIQDLLISDRALRDEIFKDIKGGTWTREEFGRLEK